MSDDLPISEEDIKHAQDVLDKEARYTSSVHMRLYDKTYMPPKQVKRRIKSYIVTHNMTEGDFCGKISVTEDEFRLFMIERKKRPQEESKVFHNAHAFMTKGKVDDGPPRKRRRQATVELSNEQDGPVS